MKDQIKGVLYMGIITLIVVIVFNFLKENNILTSNKIFLTYLNNNFDYINIIPKEKTEISYLANKIDLNNIINYEYKSIYFYPKKNTSEAPVIKEINKETKKSIVYIYNTHQKEEYAYDKNAPYNIVPTVMNTSYMLKEKLSKYNIESIVEESNVTNTLKQNNWNYAYSYKVTRLFLEKAKNDNPTLKFFIDVHRDSANKNISTIEIDKVKYARVLFILGLENENYKENYKMIEYINNEINKKYPKLSRGIYKKKGKGVNGVYNQDFSPNCILIEFGSVENTIDEVYNTVNVVGEILAKYIGDSNEN